MNRFKVGLLGTIVILVLAGNITEVVVPVPQVNKEVKLAGHTTPIVIAFWITLKYWFTGGGGTGSNPMPKPSS